MSDSTYDSDSPYERAVRRMERARANYPKAKREAERIVKAATDEYNAAYEELARHESSPGIPLPEYRTYSGALAARKADALAVLGMED